MVESATVKYPGGFIYEKTDLYTDSSDDLRVLFASLIYPGSGYAGGQQPQGGGIWQHPQQGRQHLPPKGKSAKKTLFLYIYITAFAKIRSAPFATSYAAATRADTQKAPNIGALNCSYILL